jgi:hypothetical protein
MVRAMAVTVIAVLTTRIALHRLTVISVTMQADCTSPVATGFAKSGTSVMATAIADAVVSIPIAWGLLPVRIPVVSFRPAITATTQACEVPIAAMLGCATRCILMRMTAVIAVAVPSIPTATARVAPKTVVSMLLAKPVTTRTKTSSAAPNGFAILLCTTAVVIATADAVRRIRTAKGKDVALSDAVHRVATYVMMPSDELHRVRRGYAVP